MSLNLLGETSACKWTDNRCTLCIADTVLNEAEHYDLNVLSPVSPAGDYRKDLCPSVRPTQMYPSQILSNFLQL